MASRLRRPTRRLLLALLLVTVLPAGFSPALAQSQRPLQRSHAAVARTRSSARLGVPTIVQTLNNCGPASIAEVLSYWGIVRTQQQVEEVVRADGNPHGMAPFGVPAYMRYLGMQGLLGVDGTEGLIMALISNGFPVIVSQWVSAADQIRHYRPVVGYDNRRGTFFSSDPYLGADHTISYGEFSRIWTVSDGRFLVLYPPSRQSRLDAVLDSAGWNRPVAYRHDRAWEQNRLRHAPAGGPEAFAHYYGYPSLAWDEMELGNGASAQRALREAASHGASPVVICWIRAEMAWRASRHHT